MEKRVTIRSSVINPGAGANSNSGTLTSTLILSNKQHVLTRVLLNNILLSDSSGNVLQLEKFSCSYTATPGIPQRNDSVSGVLLSGAIFPVFATFELYTREAGIRNYDELRLMPANAIYTITYAARFFSLSSAADSLQFEIEFRFIDYDDYLNL